MGAAEPGLRDLDWQALGEHIAAHRQAVGMTQQELADAAGVNVRTIVGLEAGTPRARMPRTLPRIAVVLGWDPVGGAERILRGAKLHPNGTAVWAQREANLKMLTEEPVAGEDVPPEAAEQAARLDPLLVIERRRPTEEIVRHLMSTADLFRRLGTDPTEVDEFVALGRTLLAKGQVALIIRMEQYITAMETSMRDANGGLFAALEQVTGKPFDFSDQEQLDILEKVTELVRKRTVAAEGREEEGG